MTKREYHRNATVTVRHIGITFVKIILLIPSYSISKMCFRVISNFVHAHEKVYCAIVWHTCQNKTNSKHVTRTHLVHLALAK